MAEDFWIGRYFQVLNNWDWQYLHLSTQHHTDTLLTDKIFYNYLFLWKCHFSIIFFTNKSTFFWAYPLNWEPAKYFLTPAWGLQRYFLTQAPWFFSFKPCPSESCLKRKFVWGYEQLVLNLHSSSWRKYFLSLQLFCTQRMLSFKLLCKDDWALSTVHPYRNLAFTTQPKQTDSLASWWWSVWCNCDTKLQKTPMKLRWERQRKDPWIFSDVTNFLKCIFSRYWSMNSEVWIYSDENMYILEVVQTKKPDMKSIWNPDDQWKIQYVVSCRLL